MNYVQKILSELNNQQEQNTTLNQINWIDNAKKMANLINNQPGKLTGYDCKECLNRGWFERVDEKGYKFSVQCKCMKVRRSIKAIQKSGLSNLLNDYTFQKWEQMERWQSSALREALRYTEERDGWFVATGNPGTGKTHICTAICGRLLEDCIPVKYVIWRDFSTFAKSVVTREEEYQNIVRPLKTIKVLYIDDLFKTEKGKYPTTGDINLAFEIINSRYINKKLMTIISSELTLNQILDIDEGLGSRIRERAKKYYLDFSNRKNWRLWN